MDDEEIRHLWRLREEHKRVLNELELQAVRYAGNVPTHITLQIESNKEALARINAKLTLAPIPRQTEEATGPDAALMVMRARVEDLHDTLSDSQATMQRQIREMEEATQRQLQRTATAIEEIRRENERQTKRLDIMSSNDSIREAWRERIDQKIDGLILWYQAEGEERKRGQRRNLVLNLVGLVLMVVLMLGFLNWIGVL